MLLAACGGENNESATGPDTSTSASSTPAPSSTIVASAPQPSATAATVKFAPNVGETALKIGETRQWEKLPDFDPDGIDVYVAVSKRPWTSFQGYTLDPDGYHATHTSALTGATK